MKWKWKNFPKKDKNCREKNLDTAKSKFKSWTPEMSSNCWFRKLVLRDIPQTFFNTKFEQLFYPWLVLARSNLWSIFFFLSNILPVYILYMCMCVHWHSKIGQPLDLMSALFFMVICCIHLTDNYSCAVLQRKEIKH